MSELGLFFFEENLSKDLVHLNSIMRVNFEENNTFILGNSLTREGINNQILNENIGEDRKKLVLIYPDDTSIIEWYYIFNTFINKKVNFDKHLIVNFCSNQLATNKIEFEELQRISSYVSMNDLIKVIQQESLTFSESIDLYLSKFSNIYSNKERISKRILNFIIPNYRSTARNLNKSIEVGYETKNNKNDYYHLKKLIQAADSLGINISFCAIPLPVKYKINPNIASIINQSRYSKLIDFQNSEEYEIGDFSDGYHLNETGAKKYTNNLSKFLLLRKEK